MDTLVVLGATGDLAGRLLLPALAMLRSSGGLSSRADVIGVGDEPWTVGDFRAFADSHLSRHARQIPVAHRNAFIAGLSYHRTDVTDASAMTVLINDIKQRSGSGPMAIYLALPTQLMLGAVQAIAAGHAPLGTRLAVEKPFGRDLHSAEALDAALRQFDPSPGQSAVYRVDHALAMTAVQRLPTSCVPGTNTRIQWSSRCIEQVDLLWEESLALEGRATFYDRAGALRDVMQNHLLQVLCTVAQPPAVEEVAVNGAPSAIREALLRIVRPPNPDEVRTRTRRARYTAGQLPDDDDGRRRNVPDYRAEDGVDPGRGTETFAEVVLGVGSPQWEGTRFVLRAGKALDARRRGVRVHFRPEGGVRPDPVYFDLDDPDGAAEGAGPPVMGAEAVAYQRIVADLLDGGSNYAISAAEAELGWRIFEPVLQAWAQGEVPLLDYRAGSSGPR